MKLEVTRMSKRALVLLATILMSTNCHLLAAGEKLLVIRDTPLMAGPETYYRAIDTVKKQTSVVLVEKRGDWYLVQMANGQAGWLRSDHVRHFDSTTVRPNSKEGHNLSPNNDPSPLSLKEMIVQRAGNLREQADITAPIIGKLASGQRVKASHQKGDWFYIQTSTGTCGWANIILFQPPKPAKSHKQLYLTKNANIRTEPSLNGRILGVIPAGTGILVLDSSADWYKIQYQDTSGWVNRIIISPTRP